MAVEIPVTIATEGRALPAAPAKAVFDTRDLSLDGAFLRSSSLLELDEVVTLVFNLGGGKQVRARARVIRLQKSGPPGMGVTFEDLPASARDELRAHLASRT